MKNYLKISHSREPKTECVKVELISTLGGMGGEKGKRRMEKTLKRNSCNVHTYA